MIVSCPSCSTKFNLPGDVSPGAQLRCSVCKHVFTLPDEPAASQPLSLDDEYAGRASLDSQATGDSTPLNLDGEFAPRRTARTGGSRVWLYTLLAVLVLIGGGAGGVWFFAPDLVKSVLSFGGTPAAVVPEKDMVSKITLRGVRQYSIVNEKLGPLSVIEGKAVNGFDEPRELIRIEASLYDKDGKVLDSKQQMAGTTVSLFQLQVLGDKELEQALGNRIEILSNNTNVAPGGEVPFMIVFYKPSEAATEFGVKVCEAKLPPKK